MNNDIEKVLEEYPIPEETVEIEISRQMINSNDEYYEEKSNVKINIPELTEEQKDKLEKEQKLREESNNQKIKEINIQKMKSVLSERYNKDFYYLDGYKENNEDFIYVYIDDEILMFLSNEEEIITIKFRDDKNFVNRVKTLLLENIPSEKEQLEAKLKNGNPYNGNNKKTILFEFRINENSINYPFMEEGNYAKVLSNKILDEIDKYLNNKY